MTKRNDPCPCGSGRKYKKCCINGVVPHQGYSFQDSEGLHVLGEGEKPNQEQIEKMEKDYQSKIRKSEIWDEMVNNYGLEKAEEMLKEFKVKID